MNAKERWLNYLPQVGVAVDQLVNALIPPVYTLSYADETLSARTWRAARRGKIAGRLFMPVIDALFAWQSTDPEIVGADGQPIKGHCERAYHKEIQRRCLPPEYRSGVAP